MVHMIDRHFGEILQLLKDLDLDGNTLVVFSGDNGGNPYFADEEHPAGLFAPNVNPRTGHRFRAGKGSLYEGGLRVPFIARWPGRITGGRVSDHLCYFPDLMPTLAEAAGVSCPGGIDGLSFMPALLGDSSGRQSQQSHEFLYWEFKEMTALRIGSWKGVRPKKTAAWQLHDLSADIEEKRDISAEHPEIVERMEAGALEARSAQPRTGVFDRELNAKDLQSVYPDRRSSGIDPSGLP
jgi:arylsulfatase A-like enzyme